MKSNRRHARRLDHLLLGGLAAEVVEQARLAIDVEQPGAACRAGIVAVDEQGAVSRVGEGEREVSTRGNDLPSPLPGLVIVVMSGPAEP